MIWCVYYTEETTVSCTDGNDDDDTAPSGIVAEDNDNLPGLVSVPLMNVFDLL